MIPIAEGECRDERRQSRGDEKGGRRREEEKKRKKKQERLKKRKSIGSKITQVSRGVVDGI